MESLSTLKFANRAKSIKNVARVNEDLDEKALLRRYERELLKLRQVRVCTLNRQLCLFVWHRYSRRRLY